MENLDIIILSTITSTLFVVFFVASYRELKKVELNPPPPSEENSPRANMVKFVGSLFDQEDVKKMKPADKSRMYSAIRRTIADMESDGVYFSNEAKIELEKKRKELTCEYSGLPSVKSYDINKILNK